MNKEDRLKLENELLLTKSKAQMINLYLDLLEENQKLKDRDLIIAAELTKLQDENKHLKDN